MVDLFCLEPEVPDCMDVMYALHICLLSKSLWNIKYKGVCCLRWILLLLSGVLKNG